MSDLISRQDAVDTVEELNRKVNDGREFDTICTSDVLRRINALPSADRPTGEWVECESNHVEKIYLCSNCKNYEAWGETEKTPYCPNCGAKIGGDDE